MLPACDVPSSYLKVHSVSMEVFMVTFTSMFDSMEITKVDLLLIIFKLTLVYFVTALFLYVLCA